MTRKKTAGAKAPVKVDVDLLAVRWKFEKSAENPEFMVASAVDAVIAQLRQLARAADSDDPAVQEIGLAGLRRLANRILEADPAVRALRAKGSDERVQRLVRYAEEVGYPAKCKHKVFVLSAMEKFQVKARTVDNWLRCAKKNNLLQ
jgi:hypothetical protein